MRDARLLFCEEAGLADRCDLRRGLYRRSVSGRKRSRSSSPGTGNPTIGKRACLRRAPRVCVGWPLSAEPEPTSIPSSPLIPAARPAEGKLRPDSHWATALWLTFSASAIAAWVSRFSWRACRNRVRKGASDNGNRTGLYKESISILLIPQLMRYLIVTRRAHDQSCFKIHRNGLMIVTPSTSRPWLMSSEYNSLHPSARAAATMAASQ